jgi:hypothetical protein
MTRTLSGLVLLLLTFGSAHAALLSRAGGQAYYDTALNITWLKNANLADTNSFGVAGINANGTMTWLKASQWIGAMNTANYLGTSTWRLPTVTDKGTSGCDWGASGTDCGWNVDLSTGEMAHMFYSTLGNVGEVNTSWGNTGCLVAPSYCLINDGPFSNLEPARYWSKTSYQPDPNWAAWVFDFYNGTQDSNFKEDQLYAWAVSPGDSLAVVPVPGAVWMFGSALGVMGLLRRKVLAGTA